MRDPDIIHIAVYPAQGKTHSAAEDLSALAGYLKSLLSGFSPQSRCGHIVLTNKKSSGGERFTDSGLLVVECWKKGSLSFAWSLFREILRHPKVRIVHLQHEFNQFGGAVALPLTLVLLFAIRFLACRKLVITVHEVIYPDQITRKFLDSVFIPYPVALVRAVLRFYFSVLGFLANRLIAQDEFFADRLRCDYRVRAPVDVVKIGTEIAKPVNRDEARRALDLKPAGPVVLFFGTIDWRKGLDLLLDAWGELPKGFGTLLICGGEPVRVKNTREYRTWRVSLNEKMHAFGDVQCLGFVEDQMLPTLFGATDLVVLPYIVPQRVSAVFNQTTSYGVPLLASDVFKEQAEPTMIFGETATDLAAAISFAFSDNCFQLREASLSYRERNTWEKSAQTLSEIYSNLIETSHSPL